MPREYVCPLGILRRLEILPRRKGATLRLLLLLCLRHWLLRVNYLISFASLPYFLGSLPLLPGRWMTMGFPFGQSFFLWFRVLQSDPCAELVFPQSNNLSQAARNKRPKEFFFTPELADSPLLRVSCFRAINCCNANVILLDCSAVAWQPNETTAKDKKYQEMTTVNCTRHRVSFCRLCVSLLDPSSQLVVFSCSVSHSSDQ